jgi:putative transcriptional regulator
VIVNRVSRLLGERRMTMRELGRRSGLAISTIHRLYHDQTDRLDLETLDRLCDVLGVGVGDIFEHVRTADCLPLEQEGERAA